MATSGKPWEKYASKPAATSKPWEKYAASQSFAEQPAAPEETLGESVLQGAKNLFGGAIRGAGSIGATTLAPADYARDLILGREGPLSRNEQRRADIDAGLTALIGSDPESKMYAAGKLTSEIAGTAGLGPLAGAGARAVPALARFAPALETGGLAPQMPRGMTNFLTRIGAGGLTGGATTLAVDPTQTLEGAEIGMVLGTAAPFVGALGKFAARNAEKLYRGAKAAALLKAAEGRGQDIVNALRGSVELVPGSIPTAGEAVAPLNLTRYAALQQTAATRVPELATPYFQRGQAQEAARLAAIRSVGQTPAALEAAQAARGADANRLYGLARQALVASDSELAPLLDRPSMSKAFERAAQLAREAGDEFVIGKNVPEKVVPSAIVDKFGAPVGEVVTQAESAQYPVKSLHYVKLAMDDLIKNPDRFGIGGTEAKFIGDTRKQFINWLEKNSPEYGTAREAFAAASKPINQMEVGQYLEGKLTGGLGEERARVFATAVKEAPTTIKRAVTGAPRFKNLSDILTPDQVSAVEAVKADLERGELFKQQARAAAQIGPTAEKTVTSAAAEGGVTMPSLLSRIQTVANAILKRATTGMDRKLAIEIATEMLDPKLAAASMEKALAREARIQAIKKPTQKAIKAAQGPGMAIGVNALRPSTTNNNALAEQ